MNTSKEPLVSIIMPTYNSSKTVLESINSVLNQTYKNWELLITDDCSSDNTIDLISSVKDERVRYFKLSANGGAGVARNNSIGQATGRYIAFLDSDDLWLPEKLSEQITFMENNAYPFTYTYYQKLKDGQKGAIIKSPASATYKKLLYSNYIGCLTVVYDQSKLGKHFMPKIRKRQDMALWLTLLKLTSTAYCLPKCLALYRTDTGMTQNKLTTAKTQWEFYTKSLELPIYSALIKMTSYTILGILKKLK
ncbi:MAG: glycosyl transferase [Oceanospirillaceae bacterium]|nr:glycosyl transferase [Oceanospirillaceae bacterium]MBL35254.1 glycosyl transferase [Oceanospirillaceae bacterium]MBS51590.1 glycosyl transferase [Oceanospirillaceae bacterium]